MPSNESIHIKKLAERSGMPQSKTFIKVLERAMPDDEAEFILALPASFEDMSVKFKMVKERSRDFIPQGVKDEEILHF